MAAAPRRSADGPKALSFAERVTLFVCALHKEQASALLAGFADRPRRRAIAFAEQIRQWDSSTRQARLAREFGANTSPTERLHRLVLEVPPALRAALGEHLSPEQRLLFPHLTPATPTPTPPAMRAIAGRLVREATR
jgi:hypothetical protein